MAAGIFPIGSLPIGALPADEIPLGGVLTIDPRFMDVINWTAQTSTVLAPYGVVPKLLNVGQWREWASFTTSMPAVAALNPPRPEGFAAWDDWAQQFNVAVRLLAT